MYLDEDRERTPACAPKEKLADTLSGLLRQAVRDAQAIENTPGYVLDMGVWHSTQRDGTGPCYVCMGGAVLSQTLGWPREASFGPGQRDSVSNAMYAINNMRMGAFRAAMETLGVIVSAQQEGAAEKARRIVHDSYDGTRSRAKWDDYLKAADVLESAGL